MNICLKSVASAFAIAVLGLGTVPAKANPLTETLFFTNFSNHETQDTTATYTGNGTVGNGTFTLTSPTVIATTPGADGIVLNPNNGNLLVGGQGNALFQINPNNGTFTTATPNMAAFEITVDPGKQVVYSAGSEGGAGTISSNPINPFGGSGTTVTVHGSVSTITHITFAPNLPTGQAYYTSAADNGTNPHFGTINLSTGQTTDIALNGLLSTDTWHGMDYDPSTNKLILAGGDEILEIDPLTNTIVSRIHLGNGQQFDQGAVDGLGGIFWADNNGRLLFLDYSTTGLVGDSNNFVSDTFFQGSLDDIAPLIGAGGTNNVPEPASLALFGTALLGLGFLARRRRRK